MKEEIPESITLKQIADIRNKNGYILGNSYYEPGISLLLKGCRMGRSDKVFLWYVALLINTRFRFFILE